MRQIPLTKNKVAFVDDDTYEALGHLRWYAEPKASGIFYAAHNVKKRPTYLHHFVMGHPLNRLEIDHIDGNGLNCQRSNFRIVTHRENGFNQKIHRLGRKSSRFIGVYLNKGRWVAKIGISGKQIHLGSFKIEIDAAQAYRRALEELCPASR